MNRVATVTFLQTSDQLHLSRHCGVGVAGLQRSVRLTLAGAMPLGSDPGPRFDRGNEFESMEEIASQGSLATENSDEEPLEGDAADHVEAMLRKCLQPDERDGGDDGGDDDDGHPSSESDWGQGELRDGSSSDADLLLVKQAAAPESDMEDIEEEASLRLHVLSLNRGLREFDAWASASLEDAQVRMTEAVGRAPAQARTRSGENTVEVAGACMAALAELRALHEQLRVLAVNNQALVCASTQQLLRLSHAQAEVALRHHQQTRRRHKQLRIVRKETARLCRELEERDVDAAPPLAQEPSSQPSSPHLRPLSAPPKPSSPPTAAAIDATAGGCRPVSAAASAGRGSPGGVSKALMAHILYAEASAATQVLPTAASSSASGGEGGSGGSAGGSAPRRTPLNTGVPRAARQTRAVREPARSLEGPVPRELLVLMASACERASRALGKGGAHAEFGKGGALAEFGKAGATAEPKQADLELEIGGQRIERLPRSSPPSRPSSSRDPARSRRLGGQISPFAVPQPVPRRAGGGLSSSSTAQGEAAGGRAPIDSSARALLRHPAVQAALAEALWASLAGSELATAKRNGQVDPRRTSGFASDAELADDDEDGLQAAW